jgi:hypothetical protein
MLAGFQGRGDRDMGHVTSRSRRLHNLAIRLESSSAFRHFPLSASFLSF